MSDINFDDLTSILGDNEDNMIVFQKFPDSIKRGVRYNWDKLVQTPGFMKLGFEGWRECRDHGPQPHVVYCIAQVKVNEESQDKPAAYTDYDKLTMLLRKMPLNIVEKMNDIEARLSSIEKALSFLICETRCNESEIKNPRPFPIINPVDISYILGLSKD